MTATDDGPTPTSTDTTDDDTVVMTAASAEARDEDDTVIVTQYSGTREAASVAQSQTQTEPSSYEIVAELGRGAMGEVFVARDRQLLHKVAFKRMTAELTESIELSGRFFNEAQITAQLDHPNIVPIYGLELSADGSLGYAMKLVQGSTLTDVIRNARDAAESSDSRAEKKHLAERLEIFLKVCEAMYFARRKGVLHRDLKPDNIMVGDGGVYVMDWGICRLIGEDKPETQEPDRTPTSAQSTEAEVQVSAAPGEAESFMGSTEYGTVIGTPTYMSPEQADGRVEELDERSDLYTLGLILGELVSLRKPRRSRSKAAKNERTHAFQPLVHNNSKLQIPIELESVVAKATQVLPQDRYPTVRDLAEDLRAYLRGDPVSARPDTVWQSLGRWVANHKQAALATMVALLLLGAGATILSLLHSERQLEAAKFRDHRLDVFFVRVAQHSHAIDGHFFQLEKSILRLAGNLEQTVNHVAEQARPVFFSNDFSQPSTGPPDLIDSPYYGQQISIEHPVFKLAPGVEQAEVAGDVQRVSFLVGSFEDLIRRSAGMEEGVEQTEFRTRLAQQGLPVIRTFVTLKNGVHVSYPGHGGYPEDYDGRLRPKYTLSAGGRGIRWGNPFQDRYGHGLALAASTSVYDLDGQFLGVTGLEMTFERIVDELLALPESPYVSEIYLLDEEGDIVLRALDGKISPLEETVLVSDRPLRDGSLEREPAALKSLPYASVTAALSSQRPGRISVVEEGREKVVVYVPVYSLGWWYVVVADAAILLDPDVVP